MSPYPFKGWELLIYYDWMKEETVHDVVSRLLSKESAFPRPEEIRSVSMWYPVQSGGDDYAANGVLMSFTPVKEEMVREFAHRLKEELRDQQPDLWLARYESKQI